MEIPKIQWYPGHIAKAEKNLSKIIKRVDLIIEVRDARIPLSTGHSHLNQWIIDKKHLLVINRSDMVSRASIDAWTSLFKDKGIDPLWCDSKKGMGIKEIIKSATKLRLSIDKRRLSRGMKIRPIRALILGFPNVGKSALINRIVNRKIVESARKAGVTRNLRWVRFGNGIDLLDAPGVIPPDLEDQRAALNLAICDDIGEAAYDIELVAKEFIKIILRLHKKNIPNVSINRISKRYGIDLIEGFQDPDQWILDTANKHTAGDTRRMANKLLEDFRNQMLGNFSIEVP